jgi:DNA helicase-2/ATP-dependent DNA helicase PcrA
MGLDEKAYKPGTVQARISNAKNHLVSPAGYAANKEACEADAATKMPAIREVYQRYWERCRQAGAMDFDDLLFYTWILFQKHPDVLARYREQFRYVLVDEYQDTNYAQHSIVQQLAGEHQHICVVGDDAQSIYSFRGADIDNILYFTKIYPNTRVFKLEQNYRSTQTIVCAANSLIEKNQRQIRKEVFSEKERGEAIGVFQAYSDVEEGDIVINKIKDLRRRHDYEYSDFAILYRTNAQSRIFEETLRKNGMPYKIYGGLSFYQRKEIKDVVAYFRVTVNPADEEAFKRIINYPARGIGDTTLGKIIEAATGNNTSLWNVLCDPLAYQLSINKGTHTKLQEFRELIESFRDRLVTDNAYQIGTDIIRRSGIMTDIHADNAPESLSRQENIEELVNGLQDFCALRMEEGSTDISLSDYLSDIALLTDQDSDKDNEGAKVVLMTVHSAKGLEFRNVFVVGMEENLFPGSMAGDSPRAMEEERRLFYVAITRAEEHCYLSYARTRFRYGKMEFGTPSRFLRDIDTCFLDLPHEAGIGHKVDEGAARFRKEEVRQQIRPRAQVIAPTLPRNLKKVANSSTENQSAQSMQTSLGELRVGQNIQHERFGMGEVTKLEGSGDNAKATIRFRHAGEKQLLLRFARFTVID